MFKLGDKVDLMRSNPQVVQDRKIDQGIVIKVLKTKVDVKFENREPNSFDLNGREKSYAVYGRNYIVLSKNELGE